MKKNRSTGYASVSLHNVANFRLLVQNCNFDAIIAECWRRVDAVDAR